MCGSSPERVMAEGSGSDPKSRKVQRCAGATLQRLYGTSSVQDQTENLPDFDALKMQVATWFSSYVQVLSDLASCDRPDTTALLDYYVAPARIVGRTADMVMRTADAITGFGGVGGKVESLRRCGLTKATTTALNIHPLSLRAAIVEAAWQGQFLTGATEVERFAYVIVLGANGWRINTVIKQSL